MKPPLELAAAALWWAQRGFAVLPLLEGSKAPRPAREVAQVAGWPLEPGKPLLGGFYQATTELETVARWWRRWPQANLGYALPEGQVLVDLDESDAAQRLTQAGFLLPPTLSVFTLRGQHLLYRLPVGVTLRQGCLADAGKVRSGEPAWSSLPQVRMDLRVGGKGYAILPPSRHPKGALYQLEGESLAESAPAPAWLVELFAERPRPASLTGTAGPESVDSLAAQVLAGLPAGRRDDGLFRYACRLRALGLSRQEAVVFQRQAWKRCTQPPANPFPWHQAEAKLEAAWRHPEPSTSGSGPALFPLALLSARELLALEIPPRECLLAPWLCPRELVLLHAWRGVGKTFFALGLAWAVATGGEFLGWEAPRPRRVLYLDGEMPAAALQRRLRLLQATSELPEEENLRFLVQELQKGPLPPLDRPEGQRALAPHLAGVDLLVLDNLSCLIAGEENAAEAWQPAQEWLASLRNQGLSVLLLAHSGKSGAQRGGSKREDILDTTLHLTRPADYRPAQGARFQISFEKGRNLCGEALSPFEAALGRDPHGRTVWQVLGGQER